SAGIPLRLPPHGSVGFTPGEQYTCPWECIGIDLLQEQVVVEPGERFLVESDNRVAERLEQPENAAARRADILGKVDRAWQGRQTLVHRGSTTDDRRQPVFCCTE